MIPRVLGSVFKTYMWAHVHESSPFMFAISCLSNESLILQMNSNFTFLAAGSDCPCSLCVKAHEPVLQCCSRCWLKWPFTSKWVSKEEGLLVPIAEQDSGVRVSQTVEGDPTWERNVENWKNTTLEMCFINLLVTKQMNKYKKMTYSLRQIKNI